MKRWSFPIDHPENSTPVCTVKPGKLLQLSTAIGVARMSNIMVQESQYSNEFKPTKGRLKSGRLQPLGLHSSPQLDSSVCLGIVSIQSRRSRYQRSFTAPPTITRQGPQQWNSALSGIRHTRQITSPLPLTSVQIVKKPDICDNSANTEHLQNKQLPPIVSAPTVMVSQRNTDSFTNSSNGEIDIQINSIHSDTCICENSKNNLQTPAQSDIHTPIAKSKGNHRKRHSSGGKLSCGWTSPQPLVPVVGGALLKSEASHSDNQNLQHGSDISFHVDVSKPLK